MLIVCMYLYHQNVTKEAYTVYVNGKLQEGGIINKSERLVIL